MIPKQEARIIFIRFKKNQDSIRFPNKLSKNVLDGYFPSEVLTFGYPSGSACCAQKKPLDEIIFYGGSAEQTRPTDGEDAAADA